MSSPEKSAMRIAAGVTPRTPRPLDFLFILAPERVRREYDEV